MERRDKQMTNPDRVNSFKSSRLIPAVEYLQSQRAGTMMMMKLAEATADVDAILPPAFRMASLKSAAHSSAL